MRTILVTGADGFAGTYLYQHLQKRGCQVVAGVRNRARKLGFERQGGKALVCDVSDAINVARVIASAKPDAIVHLAGTSRAADADAEPLLAYQSIVSAWANILDGARRAVPRARILLVSASDVYGNACENGAPVAETHSTQPSSMFGSLKTAAESIARMFHTNYHVDVMIARPFCYTGAGQPDQFFFASSARRLADWDPAVDGNTFEVADLDCRRDVLHVADVVEAYERLLRHGKPGETYNVCSGQAWTCRELLERMAQAANVRVEFKTASGGNRPNPIQSLCGDATKIRTQCDWQPTRSIEHTLSDLMTGVATAQPAVI